MDYCDSWAAPDLGNNAANARVAEKLYKTMGGAFFRIFSMRGSAKRVMRPKATTNQ
ncbi:hypothetical protein BOTBODRAFT_37774 [Botryobasidium botryosum FD-172 SS1]|uniref:Uncharacterized protein n=1 Tax=Botryobasidium botryosum (strain FD-172 SS1) TaxID=930990 RepID=A0A067LZC3_BOTB1|nr:hypothetical protein BOTBODRAFT_37774 [Botryobasidium botryosum FD-172 SS1]